MPVALSHTGKGCDIFGKVSRRISHCTLFTPEAAETYAENLPTTMSINHTKKVEENLFFSLSQLTRVKLCPSTQLHNNTEAVHIANQKSLCLEVQCHRFLFAIHPPLPSPFRNCTCIILRATHTSFHGVQLLLPRFSKANSRRRSISHDYHAASDKEVEKTSIERLD
jgi:hypothetical protein